MSRHFFFFFSGCVDFFFVYSNYFFFCVCFCSHTHTKKKQRESLHKSARPDTYRMCDEREKCQHIFYTLSMALYHRYL